MAYQFKEKALKIINKSRQNSNWTDKDIAEFISRYFADFMKIENSDDILIDIMSWLCSDVNTNNDSVKKCADILDKMVVKNIELIAKSDNKDPAAMLLVEVLRCVNFSQHDSSQIKKYIGLFKKNLGLEVVGDVDACVFNASFSMLDYKGGKIIMKI